MRLLDKYCLHPGELSLCYFHALCCVLKVEKVYFHLKFFVILSLVIVRDFKKFEIKRFREKRSMASQPTFLLEILAIQFLYFMNSQTIWLFSPKILVHSIIIKSIAAFPLKAPLTFWEMKFSVRQIPSLSDALLLAEWDFHQTPGHLMPSIPTVACIYASSVIFIREASTMSSVKYFLDGTTISLNLYALVNVLHLILLHILWISMQVQ